MVLCRQHFCLFDSETPTGLSILQNFSILFNVSHMIQLTYSDFCSKHLLPKIISGSGRDSVWDLTGYEALYTVHWQKLLWREINFGTFKQASWNLNCLVDIWCLWWDGIIINNGNGRVLFGSHCSPYDRYLFNFCNSSINPTFSHSYWFYPQPFLVKVAPQTTASHTSISTSSSLKVLSWYLATYFKYFLLWKTISQTSPSLTTLLK